MDYRYSRSIQQFQSSAVREILKLTQGKDIISFAGGLPAEEFFPIEAVSKACERVFQSGQGALQYGLTEGFRPLRETLSERLQERGIGATPDNLILTTGSQQAIDLLGRVFLDPGDVVLVQQPTYLAALQAFQAYQATMVPVEGDADGMAMDDLAAKIEIHRPKFVYVCPTFSNPTGHSWSIERRRALIEVCRTHNTLIIEDDPYGELYYSEAGRFRTVAALANDEVKNGQTAGSDATDTGVVYLGTFSKVVAPALRTGWAVGDRRIINLMAQAKQAADLHSSSLDQRTLYHLLQEFDIESHLAVIRREYSARMLIMANALRADSTARFTFEQPKGGMFLWVEFPEHFDTTQLLNYAVHEGVAFVPGAPFHSQEPRRNTARLNFTHSSADTIALGMERLLAALHTYEAENGAGVDTVEPETAVSISV